MFTQVALPCKLPAANLTLVSGTVRAMNISQMVTQVSLNCKLSAANLALVSGARMLWSRWRRRSDVALSMRRVVVSLDLGLVAERLVLLVTCTGC